MVNKLYRWNLFDSDSLKKSNKESAHLSTGYVIAKDFNEANAKMINVFNLGTNKMTIKFDSITYEEFEHDNSVFVEHYVNSDA